MHTQPSLFANVVHHFFALAHWKPDHYSGQWLVLFIP